jgi:hypothetical protein
MQISEYKYITGTEQREGYFAIPELKRDVSSANEFIKLAALDINVKKNTGFIYVDGFTVSQAESGVGKSLSTKYMVAVCSGSSYIMHKWISSLSKPENIVCAEVVSGTCASGIQAIKKAQEWLDSGQCEEVIVIGGERTSQDTLRLFKELRIGIMCGDGFVYLKLNKKITSNTISHINWKFAYNKNPFYFSKEQINKLIPTIPVGYVKLHGTDSPSNTKAEEDLEDLGIPIKYKSAIGHTQGISSLLETCLVMEDNSVKNRVLVTANGFGGFYGSFILTK